MPRKFASTIYVLGILLVFIAVSGSLKAVPAPAAHPNLAQAVSYYPLAVGNTWEYLSNYQPVSMKVTRQEIVNGVSCFVVESFVGSDTDSSQKEYFAVTDRGLEIYKRTHRGSDFFLKVPEPVLLTPATPGRRWTWEGSSEDGNVFLAFAIRPTVPMRLSKLQRTVEALPVVMQGRSSDGSEIQTKRWYTAGVGMVRELTLMKKAHKSVRVEADLVNYSLHQE